MDILLAGTQGDGLSLYARKSIGKGRIIGGVEDLFFILQGDAQQPGLLKMDESSPHLEWSATNDKVRPRPSADSYTSHWPSGSGQSE